MPAETSRQDTERRTATREPIRRPVVFAGVRGEGLLRQGMAVDISASGLLIHTTQPDLAGRHLEIELHPDGAPGDVVMVRGEVMWTRPLPEKGDYAMGIRFLQKVPATDMTGATYRPASHEEAGDLAAAIHKQLAAFEPAARVEISREARERLAATPKSVVRSSDGRRRYFRLLGLLLLLLGTALIVSLGTLATMWGLGVFPGAPSKVTPQRAIEVPEPVEAASSPASGREAASDAISERIDSIREEGPAYYLNRGNLYLIQGRFPAAAQAFQSAQATAGITPIERFVAELGEAQALAGGGDVDSALEILARPVDAPSLVPEAWMLLREEFRAEMAAAPQSGAARAPLAGGFTFESAPGTAIAGGGQGASPRIEIDTTRHLLSVLDGNTIKAVYPIGLGARDRTPSGQFMIVNKIENPDWYNNGDVVPAGDPDNQLGSRWLGLGDETGPTPLGIHATDDLDSIGGNQSRGCIRMRPADVEALFQMVGVGTPVSIRAL